MRHAVKFDRSCEYSQVPGTIQWLSECLSLRPSPGFILMILIPCVWSTAHAGTAACHLEGKEIAYNLQLCSDQKCSDDFDQLTFIGNKVLFHKSVGSSHGAVAHLGIATDLSAEDVKYYLSEQALSSTNSRVVKESGQIKVTYSNGRLVTTLAHNQELYSPALHEYLAYTLRKMVRITLADCETCFVSDANFLGELDGEEILDLRLKASSTCIVQNIPTK